MYLTIRQKFTISFSLSMLWAIISYFAAFPWIAQLTQLTNYTLAILIIFGIAIIPGAMNAFLVFSLLFDKRPKRNTQIENYPPVTILIAAYNEGQNITSTIDSIGRQHYPGELRVIVINDGSKDDTKQKVELACAKYSWLELLDIHPNGGKSNALNQALKLVKTELFITIDGDSYLFKNALIHIVQRYLSDPSDTVAVAGAVLVRNSRKNFVTKIQEWDYFLGIASIKRLQSLYHGTLVAQGAFSLYRTDVIKQIGGWDECVGEDIVLTWAMLKLNYRVGFAEDACLFTNAPETWKQFFKQRQRWSRGLIEAFKRHYKLLFHKRFTTLFIWWNLFFPYLDLVYTFAFIPGVILAFFGYFWIAGPMTLVLLPLTFLINYIMYNIQAKMFRAQRLKVRSNFGGFILYALFYGVILQPASVVGYIKEVLNLKKNWGTK